MKITIVNGPNLNMLGIREKEVYGNKSFEAYLEELREQFPTIEFAYYQSNVEGELINELQVAGFLCDAIILNAGGYTHTSVAIADTIAAIKAPVVEVHISNIFAREEFRHVSILGKNCAGSITGFGLNGYRLAVEACLLLSR